MAISSSHANPRLPGESSERPGMQQYLVMLREEKPLGKRPKRGDVVDQNLDLTRRFQRNLRKSLEEHGLWSQVAHMGEPMAFPLVTLSCTPEVADFVAKLPDVEEVVQDSEGLQTA